ncbi:hypothetical protein JXA47_02915 [Candidatus Sumerlaeota bacterium]|nr:hypothetical protein [Candidatus Sumerlaeota bacterium]
MWLRISQIACVAGIALSLFIGIEPQLPGGVGCGQGWFFNCSVVQASDASTLLAIPMWLWGSVWFALMFTLLMLRRGQSLALILTLIGWLMISHLRGVELLVLHAACPLCWLVGLAGILAGIEPLRRAMKAWTSGGRALLGGGFAVALAVAFLAGRLWPAPDPLPTREELGVSGWQWVPEQTAPLTAADLMLCGPETPTMVLVLDPSCDDCQALREGILSEERIALFLSEHCRVMVMLEDLAPSALAEEVDRTPAIVLLGADGQPRGAISGEISEEGLLGLVARTYAP